MVSCPDAERASAAFPKGQRRWNKGRFMLDYTYYTFEDYIAYARENGLAEEWEAWAREEGLVEEYVASAQDYGLAWEESGVDWLVAAAVDLWEMSADKEKEDREAAAWVREVQETLAPLPRVHFEALFGGAEGLVLELVHGDTADGVGAVGTTLRMRADGALDMWGGVGPESTFGLEVVKKSPTLQVRLRGFTGAYLQGSGSELGFWPWNDATWVEEPVVLEVLPRDAPHPVISLATKGGCILGTFAPRRVELAGHARVAGGPKADSPLKARLKAAAQRAVEADPGVQGKRRHLQDSNCKLYSFQQMLIHFQRLFQLKDEDAMEFTRTTWRHACAPEPEPAWQIVAAQKMEDVEM